MKPIHTLLTAIFAVTMMSSCGVKSDNQEVVNHNYMWFDCEANYATLSHPDSIRFISRSQRILASAIWWWM